MNARYNTSNTRCPFLRAVVIWVMHRLKPIGHMSFLSTTPFAAFLAPTLRCRLVQPIAGRRFMTVFAVLGYPLFQRLYSRFQLSDDCYLFLEQHQHRLFTLLEGGLYLCTAR